MEWESLTTSRKEHCCCITAVHKVDKIFDKLEDVGDEKDYKKAVEKLTAHFSPQVNITYEVYNFRQAKQKEGHV